MPMHVALSSHTNKQTQKSFSLPMSMSLPRHLSIIIFRPSWPSLHPSPLFHQLPGTKKQTRSRQTNANKQNEQTG
jgi:hypothetical protein